ncbi:chemotaxis protein CheA [Chengkuizengella axinellae]|uniref:Chemotaxis protein CheA n=1 Tax=Chengkuizengella axinellae TaxID=3064388 RepID=A0ABT9IVS3_9BACL|nr:chemotaxis protein CheA [Chengkuizengella sp. 2205SS18-9]MDP5273461.1 chemotaxis protein CheA [Chengkuizengella sp. 2205SS18-9]
MSSDQYLNMFIDEAKEHLQHLNDNVMKLENTPGNMELVQEIFRSAHTLKGMAATMGFNDLSSLTHEMENVLDLVRNNQLQMDTFIFDALFKSLDHLEMMLTDIFEGGTGKADVEDIVKTLHNIVVGEHVQEDSSKQHQEISNSAYVLDEYQHSVLKKSLESKKVFFIKVLIDEGCLLKVARVYMVTTTLERYGEIVKITPRVEDVEQELNDNELLLYYISDVEEQILHNEIMNISEIYSVQFDRVDLEFIDRQVGNNIQVEDEEFEDKQPEIIQAEDQQIVNKQSEIDQPKIKQIDDKKLEDKQPEDVIKTENKQTGIKQYSAGVKVNTESVSEKQSRKPSMSRTIRVDTDKLDTLMNLFSELLIDRVRLEALSSEINHMDLTDTVEHMSRVSGDIQNIVLNLRMMPIESVFNRFPRMVRDLAKSLDKEVEFIITGADTELDRNVIDEIGDPLVHLIRNALDHGIESPAERLQNNKPEKGTLLLRAYHSGNHVFIEIEEDGRGIDRGKILDIAIKKQIISQEDAQKMSDEQIQQLIFASGFSTADKVSDISGRGVGLDVVKTKINALGGQIQIHSEEGNGTKFSIQLPLTLSIIQAMLVKQGEEKYAIPLSSIVETDILQKKDIKIAHNIEMIEYRDRLIPILFLKNIFDIPGSYDPIDYNIVILQQGDKRVAIVVDEFIGQQEIVLKSLGKYLTNIYAISGATILGDGHVALIVDPNALFK